jgi:hypothetical protein
MTADRGTMAAVFAVPFLILDLLFVGNCFRVMTPAAGKTTSLEENCGSDARAVIGGKTLNIGDKAGIDLR